MKNYNQIDCKGGIPADMEVILLHADILKKSNIEFYYGFLGMSTKTKKPIMYKLVDAEEAEKVLELLVELSSCFVPAEEARSRILEYRNAKILKYDEIKIKQIGDYSEKREKYLQRLQLDSFFPDFSTKEKIQKFFK